MISVVRRNSIVGGESDFTRAPMTPRDVRRKYSNGLDFEVVFKNGYRNNGMCAKTSAYANTRDSPARPLGALPLEAGP